MPASTPRRAGRQAKPGARFMADVLADNARGYRLLRRLEQADVAERMGSLGHPWSQVTVSQVENGRRNLTADELLGLAMVFGVAIGALLDPTGPDGRGRDALDHASDAEPLPAATGSAWAHSRSVVALRWDQGPAGFAVEPAPVPPLAHTSAALAAFTSDAKEADEA
jgi:transcriptional regulator with XRE-family HTH domain